MHSENRGRTAQNSPIKLFEIELLSISSRLKKKEKLARKVLPNILFLKD